MGISVLLGMGVLAYKYFSSNSETQPQASEGWGTGAKVGVGLAAVAAIVAYFKGDELKQCLKDSVKNQKIKAIDGPDQKYAAKAPGQIEAERPALEHPDGSNILCIGDSIVHGFQLYPKWLRGKRPQFIGKDGMKTADTLALLKQPENSDKIQGKDVLMYTGGNSVGRSDCPPKAIVADMIEMANICKQKKAKSIKICIRFPTDGRRKIKEGEEWFAKRQTDSMALREELKAAYKAGLFPPGTQLIDLFQYFADEDGELPPQLVDTNSKDLLHPRLAYGHALNYIFSKKAEEDSRQLRG